MSIAILVPVCSRNQPWTRLEESNIFQYLLPSFQNTKSPGFRYTFYVGIDDNDAFFLKYVDTFRERGFDVTILTDCNHRPATAWNILFAKAIEQPHDYFFQIGDDVVIETPGWTEKFIEDLKTKEITGPRNQINYLQRVANGKLPVIENAFVTRKHWDRFGYFFHPSIRNWYCDDWITRVYNSVECEGVYVQNKTVDQRYDIAFLDVEPLIKEGIRRLRKGCFSFCLYGNYSLKYYQGLLENVQIIQKEFPTWDIIVYVSPEAEWFVKHTCPNVIIRNTGVNNSVNMVYRFLPIFDDEYDVKFFRDTDSRIHQRDIWCIDHFLKSNYNIQTIRDHAWHEYRIMGGLWGCKKIDMPFSKQVITDYIENHNHEGYGVDCRFLTDYIYPAFKDSLIVYSYDKKAIYNDPTEHVQVIEYPIVNNDFCGNVVLWKEYNQFESLCI